MTRKILGVLALAVVLVAGFATAGVLFAQKQMQNRMGGDGMGMMDMMSMMRDCPMMGAMAQGPAAALRDREELGLTQAQVQKLETLQAGTEQARTQAMQRMRALHQEIAKATQGERFDEAAARAGFDRMGNLHTEMGVSMLRTRNEVRQLLTPEQRKKLDAKGSGMMGMGGMQGMMGGMDMENCPMMQGGMTSKQMDSMHPQQDSGTSTPKRQTPRSQRQ